MTVYAHYDREADIAWFVFGDMEKLRSGHSDQTDWGLIDRDIDDNVIGLEFWEASERLPAELLEALPEPKGEGTVVERQSA